MSAFLLLSAALAGGLTEAEVAPAWSTDEVVRRAEEAFRQGLAHRDTADAARAYFRQSALYFEELHRRGACNSSLFRNLGNAQLLAGDLPGAILSYHRGLRLAPTDRELLANLAAAREMAAQESAGSLGRQTNEQQPRWLPHFHPKWLFGGAFAGYLVAWVFLTRWLMTRRHGYLAVGGLLLLIAIMAVLLVSRLDNRSDRGLVVIAEDGALLRKGNNLAFPPRYDVPLNRGAEARLLFARDNWLQIELAGGQVGWVPRQFTLVDE